MSQRTGSIVVPHLRRRLLAGGLRAVRRCSATGGAAQSGVFRIFGQNALAAYIIHPIVADAVKPYVPEDAPAWYLAAGFGLYFAICTLFNRYLEKHQLFLRM